MDGSRSGRENDPARRTCGGPRNPLPVPPLVGRENGVRPRIVDIIQKLHGGRQDGAGVGELGRHLEGQVSLRTERVDCTSCAAGVSPTVIMVASSSTVIFAEIGQKCDSMI